jgi:glycerol-3-phosphate cytidylyltransferase-like family protein
MTTAMSHLSNFCCYSDDTVVYIDGAFDLFHVGHVETLEKARKLGTFLYVVSV